MLVRFNQELSIRHRREPVKGSLVVREHIDSIVLLS